MLFCHPSTNGQQFPITPTTGIYFCLWLRIEKDFPFCLSVVLWYYHFSGYFHKGVGPFILWRSLVRGRSFEVHTQIFRCAGRTSSGTCNCAVAVKEGNVILIINACHGTSKVGLGTPKLSTKVLTGNSPPRGAGISRPIGFNRLYKVNAMTYFFFTTIFFLHFHSNYITYL